MPNNPTAQDFVKSASAIIKDPSKLWPKLNTLRKYSWVWPVLPRAELGKVAMFHNGRSGSTVLALLLDQHPQIYWGHEIYLPIFRPYRKSLTGAMSFEVDHRALLEKSCRWAGRRYYGFEVKFWHLERTRIELDDYAALLREFGVEKYIILERKNLLKRIVSSKIGTTHDRVELRKSEKTSLLTVEMPMTYHVHNVGEVSLVEYLQSQEAQFTYLRSLLKDEQVLELSSAEDVFPDPVQGYRRICEFVGVEPATVEVPTRRANPYPLKDTISNFADVERALQNTPYEWMLYTED